MMDIDGSVLTAADMVLSLVALLLLSILVPLLPLFVTVLVSKKTSTTRSDGRGMPPSPPSLPVFGNLHLLGSLPHRSLRSLAASYGPVMLLRLGRVLTVVVSSAAAAEEAMKTRDLAFASRPSLLMADRFFYGARDAVFVPYGEYWRQARRICVVHLLSARRILSFRRVREQEAAALLDRVRHAAARAHGGAAVNLSDPLIMYANAIICRAAFGDRQYGLDGDDGGGKLRKLFAEFEELLGTVPMGEMVPWLWWVDVVTGLERKTRRTFEQMDRLLERVIADHRQRRRGDLRTGEREHDDDHRDFVDVLLDVSEMVQEPGIQLDTVGIKAIILDMFAAATDTSFTLLEWAMAELITHPRDMRKLQDEIRSAVGVTGCVTEEHLLELRYLKAVIKETLRLHPPAPLLLPRETLEDTELLGHYIPAGTRVMINAWAIGRDPATWEQAEEFVPERFLDGDAMEYHHMVAQDFGFVPFGAGRRGCPGVGFAVPSNELALASLLYHFDWEPPGGRKAGTPPLDMSEVHGLSVHLKSTLLLVAKPWSP